MNADRVVHRTSTLTLAAIVCVVGMPCPIGAAGDKAVRVAGHRGLTIHGRPLSQIVAGTTGVSGGRPRAPIRASPEREIEHMTSPPPAREQGPAKAAWPDTPAFLFTPSDTPAPISAWSRVVGLPYGTEVTVALQGSKRTRRRVVRADESSLTVNVVKPVVNVVTDTEVIAREDILEVRTARRLSGGRRALGLLGGFGGAVAGAFAGGFAGALMAGEGEEALGGMFVGMHVGLVGGAVLGYRAVTHSGGDLIYRAP